MESFYTGCPLNFAHRGASFEAPENTLAAFLLAAELGVDGIEFDVQLSKDGQVVVIHDFSLETTTNGRGPVANRTLAELQELDAGSWFDPVFTGQRVPTLHEAVEALPRSLRLNIELKINGWRGNRLASRVVRIIEEHQLLDRVIVSSFNPVAVLQVRRLNPEIATGLLYASRFPILLRQPWMRHLLRLDALHPHHTQVNERLLRWAQAQGYRVHTWTVDDPEVMRQLVRQEVDLIITNRPDLLRGLLQSSAALRLTSDTRANGE